MKKSIIICIAYLISAAGLFAANYDTPVLVDLDSAKSEITGLAEINEDLGSDSVEKQALMESLTDQIESNENKITAINGHLDDLWDAAGTLHSMVSNSVNRETRRRLMDELELNRSQRYELEGMKDDIYQEIAVQKQSLYVAERRITKNTVDTKNNLERINWLENCISLTEARYPEVDEMVVESQTLSNAVADFIRQG